jgi:DNA-binding GntR family transcriptional regulator
VKIDSASPEHVYLQLASLLRQQILSGHIATKLPSLTELTAETQIAVIDVLAREHLVQRVPGRGTFVTSSDSNQHSRRRLGSVRDCLGVNEARPGYKATAPACLRRSVMSARRA